MQLTDPLLPWLLAIIAAGFFGLAIFGIPRWRRRAVRVTSRAVAVLLMNATVISICFLALNNTYVFYSSWSDVFGTGGKEVTLKKGTDSTQVLKKVAGHDPIEHVVGARDYKLPDHKSSLQTYHVRDVASGAMMQVLVKLPVGYNPASSRSYPVIIGLHGFPSVPKSFTKINFLKTAAALTKQHRLTPTIFVIPQINSPKSLDTECVNGPAGSPQTDTWLSQELPQWVVKHLHVRTNRQSWATLGYSFGGWCAAELTIRHPQLFAAAISFAGYFEPDFGRKYRPLDAAQLRSYDLIRIASGHRPPPVAVWAFASKQDHLAYPSTHRFVERARAPMSVEAIIVPVGGHRNTVYEPYTARAYTWLAETLPDFRG